MGTNESAVYDMLSEEIWLALGLALPKPDTYIPLTKRWGSSTHTDGLDGTT